MDGVVSEVVARVLDRGVGKDDYNDYKAKSEEAWILKSDLSKLMWRWMTLETMRKGKLKS